MNKQIIESLGFTEDLTFQLEDWVKPCLSNPNVLSFYKFQSLDSVFNLYYCSSNEWSIILEKMQPHNVFIFKIETIDELIILLNQTGLSLYTNCDNLDNYCEFLSEYPEFIIPEILQNINENTVAKLLVENWDKLGLICNFHPMFDTYCMHELNGDNIYINAGIKLPIKDLQNVVNNSYREIEKINMDFDL